MNTKTILVSRFNWPHQKWKNCHIEEYRSWISERLYLFEKYTIKSIRNCYVKPDIWLILTSDNILDCSNQLKDILEDLPYRLVKYSSGLSQSESIRQSLSDIKYPAEIRMTRLDSDDLISSCFFAKINALKFTKEELLEGITVSFPGGCNYISETDSFYYSSYPENPFLTFIEYVKKPNELKTVFFRMHTEMCKPPHLARFLRSYYPMWSTIIHENNLANDSLISTNLIELSTKEFIKKKFGIYAN